MTRWPRSSGAMEHDLFGSETLCSTRSSLSAPGFRPDVYSTWGNDMTVMHAVTKFLVVGIGGSTRRQSSGELVLGYGLRIAEQDGAPTKLIAAEDLQLPMYDPAPTAQNPQASRIVDLVYRADALMIASPAYHAGSSGLVKNVLDHLEDLSLADPPYLEGKSVACITTLRGAQGDVLTLVALRWVVHALRGWPTPLGRMVDSSTPAFGPDDEPLQGTTRTQLQIMTTQLPRSSENSTSTNVPCLAGIRPLPARTIRRTQDQCHYARQPGGRQQVMNFQKYVSTRRRIHD